MTLPSRPNLQSHTRAAWRRAADELLIDAIFGSSPSVIRDDTIAPAAAALARTRDTAPLAPSAQAARTN